MDVAKREKIIELALGRPGVRIPWDTLSGLSDRTLAVFMDFGSSVGSYLTWHVYISDGDIRILNYSSEDDVRRYREFDYRDFEYYVELMTESSVLYLADSEYGFVFPLAYNGLMRNWCEDSYDFVVTHEWLEVNGYEKDI